MPAVVSRSAAALTAAALSGCVTPNPPPRPVDQPTYAYTFPVGSELSWLPGWAQEDHVAALRGLAAGCGAARTPKSAAVCAEAKALLAAAPNLGRATARRFLEQRFGAVQMDGGGLLTGYYMPEHQARTRPDAEFSAPLRAPPAGLASGSGPERAVIEQQGLGEPLAWMRPEELFFLQIQGSGGLVLENGERRKAAYAANNGRPFIGLAAVMRQRGLLADDQTSATEIKRWLAQHRGPEADALMRENPRYVWFNLQPDTGGDPAGAANIPLPAGRAVAVDPAHHAYGDLFWISANAGALAGAFPTYRRLVTALDTGGAIRGPVRADLYIGRGAAAGAEAGRIRHQLLMWRLVPR